LEPAKHDPKPGRQQSPSGRLVTRAVYSWMSVWLAPQAPEKTTKIRTAAANSGFLPKISLNLAQMMSRPGVQPQPDRPRASGCSPTAICEEIGLKDPGVLVEPAQVIRDGQDGGAGDGRLHLRHE
jgi:hypothetical protein